MNTAIHTNYLTQHCNRNTFSINKMLISLILFISTTYISESLFSLACLIFIFTDYTAGKPLILRKDALVFLFSISICVFLVSVINFDKVNNVSYGLNRYFPFIPLLTSSYLISTLVDLKVKRYLIFLICIESLVGLFEYTNGVRTFFDVSTHGVTEFGSSRFLYYNRVYGLSTNSSIFSLKLLWASILLCEIIYYDYISKKTASLIAIILAIGYYTTFNRTAIAATGLLFFLFIYHKGEGVNKKSILIVTTLSLLAIVTIYIFKDILLEQFLRGKSTDSSGRLLIWSSFLEFIINNPQFGNYGHKLFLQTTNGLYHAHNSYLELISSNGILISAPFIIGYYLYFIRNKKFTSIMLVYSLFQYGLLWGNSFSDILFFSLIPSVGIGSHNLVIQKRKLLDSRV